MQLLLLLVWLLVLGSSFGQYAASCPGFPVPLTRGVPTLGDLSKAVNISTGYQYCITYVPARPSLFYSYQPTNRARFIRFSLCNTTNSFQPMMFVNEVTNRNCSQLPSLRSFLLSIQPRFLLLISLDLSIVIAVRRTL